MKDVVSSSSQPVMNPTEVQSGISGIRPGKVCSLKVTRGSGTVMWSQGAIKIYCGRLRKPGLIINPLLPQEYTFLL
jgi:hypothetical protein